MDALKKNKFLSTYFGVLAVGVLGLGYLLFSSWKANKAAAAAHEAAQQAVTALQSKPLFPNSANLQARKAQVEEFSATVTKLQQGLLASQPALDQEASSDKFQSTLTETLNAIKAQAELTKLNSRAGAEFDLGFGKYLANLPPRQAVPDLIFQLGAVDAMVRTMLTDRVTSIDDIARQELDVESGAQPAAADPKAAGGKAGAAKKPSGPASALPEELVLKRYPMEVRFTGTPRSVQDVLNHLAASKDYFYAVRSLRVENERKAGPTKVTEFESSGEETKKDSNVVLGGESVSVWLALDLIRFLDPAKAAQEAKAAQDAKTAAN
jgi:hypothetical protein